MRFDQLAHVVAAAADVTKEEEIVVVGSQAILGSHDDPPEAMLRSMEADVYPYRDPAKADAIDGALGDGSQFHRTYGYYAHGVGPETAKAPAGWASRLVRVTLGPRPGSKRTATALCLEAHDLVLAKCVAGRDHDWQFVRLAVAESLVDLEVLLRAIPDLPTDAREQARVRSMLEGIAGARR